MKNLPPLPKPATPAKRPSLPDGTIVVLASIFAACAGLPYVVRDEAGEQWARGTVATTPLLWMIAAFFVIKPQWPKLNRLAKDTVYLSVLLGFVGQLTGVVLYMWLMK